MIAQHCQKKKKKKKKKYVLRAETTLFLSTSLPSLVPFPFFFFLLGISGALSRTSSLSLVQLCCHRR